MSLSDGRVVYWNDFYRVEVLDDGAVARVIRKNRPFMNETEVDEGCEPVQRALDALGRARTCLLIDSRQAPARNDPAYEQLFQPHRSRMVSGVKRVAILMGSAVGKLHAERMLLEDHGATNVVSVFDDEEAALAFLRQTGPTSTAPSSRRRRGT